MEYVPKLPYQATYIGMSRGTAGMFRKGGMRAFAFVMFFSLITRYKRKPVAYVPCPLPLLLQSR